MGNSYPEYAASLPAATRHQDIHFGGAISRQAPWHLRSQGSVVAVAPSAWYETASPVTQEAFAARVPVVASQWGALDEREKDGVDGRLCPPGDATALRERLLRLESDGNLLDALRANIRPARTMEAHVADIGVVHRDAPAERSD